LDAHSREPYHQVRGGHSLRNEFAGAQRSEPQRSIVFSIRRYFQRGGPGLSFATFLLGDVNQFQRYVSTSTSAAERQKRWFFYGQDSWRISSKFTMTYGVRWEIYFPETVNAKGNGGFANLEQGVIKVADFGGVGSNGDVRNTYKAFAPRLSFAYQFDPRPSFAFG